MSSPPHSVGDWAPFVMNWGRAPSMSSPPRAAEAWAPPHLDTRNTGGERERERERESSNGRKRNG
jgi:hypothetical protein